MPLLPPETATRLLERVVHLYTRTFEDIPDGRSYLERRGITDAGLYSRHCIGYATGTLNDLLPRDGHLKDDLRTLGILLNDPPAPEAGSGQAPKERFAGCVVFPVHDVEGHLVTLCGIPHGNDSCKSLYLPGRPVGIWNAAAMKLYPDLILAESVMDALSVMIARIHNLANHADLQTVTSEKAFLVFLAAIKS